ncbi:MAG: hypothetical protein H0V70_27355 [Ktedonobacteraceae bacterium]|nr:hypothetical protein [Ktedonobacteraceae bacterium]
MSDDTISPVWLHHGWFEEATAWIQEQLHQLHYPITGDIKQVYASPTSCVLSVATTRGDIYFKVSAPLFKYEPLLTQTISQLLPAYTLRVLNVDDARSWLLMEDAGPSLRKLTLEQRDVTRWQDALSTFARFQIESIPYCAQLEAAGCPDRTLARIPELFDALLSDTSAFLVDQKDGVPGDEMEQLHAFKPQLVTLCEELGCYNIPDALHHDDLSANNIALNGRNYTFFDWAESAITHPFCSVLIPLRAARYIFKLSEDELKSIRDSYLSQWVVYQPMESLQHAFELAQRVAILCRCLTWQYVITHVDDRAKAEFHDAAAYWLRLFLHNGEEFEEETP